MYCKKWKNENGKSLIIIEMLEKVDNSKDEDGDLYFM